MKNWRQLSSIGRWPLYAYLSDSSATQVCSITRFLYPFSVKSFHQKSLCSFHLFCYSCFLNYAMALISWKLEIRKNSKFLVNFCWVSGKSCCWLHVVPFRVQTVWNHLCFLKTSCWNATGLMQRRHRPTTSKVTTTLQSMMNAKLSKQRFWHCHENGLIKTIQTAPRNL